MTDITAPLHGSADLGASSHKPKLDTPPNPLALILFFGFLGAGVLFWRIACTWTSTRPA
jgi:hypothetical protein